MARQARQESSTGYYHLMMRGINGESIFGQDRGKLHFLELLQGQQEEGLLSLVAWCVMDTHAHVMVKAKKDLAVIQVSLPHFTRLLTIASTLKCAKTCCVNAKNGQSKRLSSFAVSGE